MISPSTPVYDHNLHSLPSWYASGVSRFGLGVRTCSHNHKPPGSKGGSPNCLKNPCGGEETLPPVTDFSHQMSSFKLSRGARRKNLLQVDSLVDGHVKTSVGTRRVQEILQRCHYLASKKGQDLHTLRKNLKEDEERATTEKIARRLSAYFASLNSKEGSRHGYESSHSSSGCCCYRVADWPALDPDIMLLDKDSDDSDDFADELYSTVYLGGTTDWANKYENNGPNGRSPDTRRGSVHTAYQMP